MIRALLLGLSAIVFSTGSHATEPLTPRYRQVLGMELFGDIFASYYGCSQDDGAKRMYLYDNKRNGALIAGIRKGSPAEKAGLQCRDIIMAVDGYEVRHPEEVQRRVAAATNGRVELLYRSPLRPDDTSMDVAYSDEPKQVVVTTTTLDEVEELKRRVPLETNFNIADVFGPKFVFDAHSTFSEISPGVIRFELTLMHNGDQEVLPFESVLLPYLGVLDMYPEIGRGKKRLITIDAHIADAGIPVLTAVDLRVARRIEADGPQLAQYLGKRPHRVVQTIEGVGGSEPNWYEWRVVRVQCFLPEKLAHELIKKEKRIGSLP